MWEIRKTIAVEGSLGNLRDVLLSQGYQIVDLNKQKMDEVSAVVITGMDKDFMDMQDIKTNVPVINAEGRADEDIVQDLNERFKRVE